MVITSTVTRTSRDVGMLQRLLLFREVVALFLRQEHCSIYTLSKCICFHIFSKATAAQWAVPTDIITFYVH